MHTQAVELPENVKASFEIATPLNRLFAFGLDLVIQGVFFFVFILIMALTVGFTGGGIGIVFVFAVAILVFFLVFVGYFFFFEGLFSGRTPGKVALGLRVIREDGEEVGAARGITRAFLRFLIVGPLPIVLAFGGGTPELIMAAPFFPLGAWMFIDRKARGIPDLAAGTFVIKQKLPPYRTNRPYVPLYFELPHHYFPLNHAEMEALTPDDYVKLEEFGTRLSTIRSTARRQAAIAAASALATRMNYGAPIEPDYAEVFLFEMHSALKQQLQQLYPDLYE